MLLNLLNQLAVSFDLPILDWIQAHLQSGFMDTIMPIITVFGDAGIFWIACAVVLLFFPKTRKIGLGMGIAMAMGLLVCNVTLKPLVARIRPYDFQIKELGKTWNDILLAGKLLVETPHDFSFPSGHTIASFEAATVLLINNKKFKAGIPALILAILIAFSRLYLYVHYPTDVIFSVFAGILFGFIGHLLAQKIKLPSGKKGKYQR
jgi:undecaprenyl-diphosphatase